MFKLSGIKKLKALSAALAASLMVTVMAPVTYADNVAAVVKAINLSSYKLVDSTHLNLYFDKGLASFSASQVKVLDGATPLSFTAAATSGGADWNCATPPGGTAEQLTFSSALSTDTTYTVKVSGTIQMGNTYHQNIGNYWGHNDIVFTFRTPSTFGTSNYTGTPGFTVIPCDLSDTSTGIGVSSNVELIADRPIDPNSLTVGNVKLQYYNDSNSAYEDVIEDTVFDTTSVAGAKCYDAQMSISNTVIFIPETCGGSATPAYNLDDTEDYKLIIPTGIKAVDGDDFSYNTENDFSTGDDTVASLGNTTPTVTGHTSSSVSLSWSDVAADSSGVAPSSYLVYVSTNPYFDFSIPASVTIDYSGNPNTATVSGLSSGTTYYFRVVGANASGEEGGFSNYVQQATD